ncbi:flagellar M-ring protein FliF [Hylemonella gracilis str. Niagara R]|uniref:Flagellar M-ring protein n=1 Tax=Hylemonella gracilis str. Niagara R TaxID=1458275 RepID=A0A016XC15_9BURK|nr:flagellar basal-body MS-ring/collar protein FliF [Hylemonella gracilis]EYC49629.1 flagellar M-ring protein FliF [Hylemonella gracilis str. Niagara R]
MTPVATSPMALPANPTLSQRFAALERGQKMRLAVGVALLVAVILAAVLMNSKTEWRVLFSGLSDKDGGAIVAQLTQMQVPYQYTEGGGAIMVPADKVHDIRLRLASQGLPKGSVTGFELMENSRFGATQFQERVNFQRGLEGELTRSIQALSSVQSARVHLALPQQNGFFREQQKPSASVLLSLYPGRILDRAQIAGIVHLVSSSVPEMKPEAVSIVDDTGKLLSQSPDGAAGQEGIDTQQLKYVQQIEAQYRQRILDILEPVVGKGNIQAQVTADVDFSQSEQTSETHTPNQAPDTGAVRSQQTLESTNPGPAGPTGIPGAVSNQPPGPNAAPINAAAQPLAPGVPQSLAQAQGQGAAPLSTRKESIVNYEVDKTVRVVRAARGAIRRLSAAVVVNQRTQADARGNVAPVPLTQQQVDQMTALVRESIGFNGDRGDSVNLMNAPFVVDAKEDESLAFWQQPAVQELARDLAWPVGAVLLALAVLFGVVRPVLKAMQAPPKPQFSALLDDDLELGLAEPVKKGPRVQERQLEEARKLARENPAAVAGIVKAWIGSNKDEMALLPQNPNAVVN